MLTVVAGNGSTRQGVSLLDDVVREGARRMLAAALEAEVDAYLADLADQRGEDGRRQAKREHIAHAADRREVRAPQPLDLQGAGGDLVAVQAAIER